MAKNEVGEFELVLGNKQLLSVFFIVVVLLGVFFTMGYIVGRNSGGAGTLEATNRKPTIVDSPTASSPTAPAPSTPEPEPKKEEPSAPAPAVERPKVDDKAAAKEAAAKREAEQRLADEKLAEERKAEAKRIADEKKAAEDKKADKKKDDKKKGDKAGAEAPPRAPSGPLSGTYLQLAAVPRTEADLLVSVLQKKGFKAAVGAGPEGSNLFRVLVGPLPGADAISSTRNSLNDAGMPGSKAIVKRF